MNPVIYLAIAYGFAIVVLAGYLAWSLRKLRRLERKQ
ncbi:MAG TPA: heme exporter protein CcmD [Candidatus Dormibacteraeota bacterium]|nr:heme exporter protein CcmD [Candidatus Dormibacteraeota bacterium]